MEHMKQFQDFLEERKAAKNIPAMLDITALEKAIDENSKALNEALKTGNISLMVNLKNAGDELNKSLILALKQELKRVG